MDFNEKDQMRPEGIMPPTPPTPPRIDNPLAMPSSPRKKSSFWRVIVAVLFSISVIGNILLVMMLIGMGVLLATGHEQRHREDIIKTGPRDRRIAVVALNGIIDDRMYENITTLLERIRRDGTVKAVILQINSPGGSVSASDRIHNRISRLSRKHGIPTVAAMQAVAASGGYYVAVGCDVLVAEPATITGSIGVIMHSFVVQELLEDKLGIQPVVIEAGGKKDWPSPFKPVTDEQRAYLDERLIRPAFERFVEVVRGGRPNLTEKQVAKLADGSIYTGQAAFRVGLVDRVGYMEEAVEEAMKLAGLDEAMVVRFREPLTLSELLMGVEGRTTFRMDRSTIYEMSTPQLMYLWGL
ncbi:MAG TPA: signal peptide peptidase SppA [Sedimentisphaerales bacterium]|nr:signal peptide peptidase SppA [Sedimentisphaerales bacterium]